MAKKPKNPKLANHRKKAIKTRKDRSAFWRGVGAVSLIIAGIVLTFGAFIHAPIPHDFWHGAWWALGWGTIAAPFALLYLGSLKFIDENQRIPLSKMAGTIGL